MRICPSCGYANADDATKCVLCGHSLASAEPPAEAAPAGAPEAPFVVAPAAEPPQLAILAPPTPAPPTPAPYPLPPVSAYAAAPPPPQPYGMPAPAPASAGMLPPRPPLVMPRPQLSRIQQRNRYLLGLGLGIIPLLIGLATVGTIVTHSIPILSDNSGLGVLAALALYVASFIAMIVCLAIDRARPVGYGLLTMVVASPILIAVSCFGLIALASRP
jgi:hypothetical protein